MVDQHALGGADTSALPQTRRGILKTIAVACSSAAAAIIAVPVSRFLAFPLRREPSSQWVRLGPVNEVLGPGPKAVRFTFETTSGYVREERSGLVWSLRRGDEVLVLSAVCTHMGCNVAWSATDDAFVCPCHGGRYDTEGRVTTGPPPRPLQRHATRVEDGQLWFRLGDATA